MVASPRVGIVYGDAENLARARAAGMGDPFETCRLLPWNHFHAVAVYRRSVWEQNRGYDVTICNALDDMCKQEALKDTAFLK